MIDWKISKSETLKNENSALNQILNRYRYSVFQIVPTFTSRVERIVLKWNPLITIRRRGAKVQLFRLPWKSMKGRDLYAFWWKIFYYKLKGNSGMLEEKCCNINLINRTYISFIALANNVWCGGRRGRRILLKREITLLQLLQLYYYAHYFFMIINMYHFH